MLTRQELYHLFYQGPLVTVQLIEDFYAQLAATEPPIVRYQQLTIDAQLQTIKKLQARIQKLEMVK